MSERFVVNLGVKGFLLRLEKDGREEFVGDYATLGGAMSAARAIDRRVPIKVEPVSPQ